MEPRGKTSEFQSSKVGFPIRKFTDQSLFAAPRDLSQRTTSFIASQRQGIHRMPLRHLIVLIFDAHPTQNFMERAHKRCATSRALHGGEMVLRDPSHGIEAILKTSLLRISFDDGAVRPRQPDP